MARTLVVQLGMLGDVIQTTPLLSDLIREAGSDKIDLLVLHQYRDALRGLPGLGNTHTLPVKWFNELERAITEGFRENKIPSGAYELLKDLNLPRYGRVISCSTTALGCWLTGRIPCQSREGGVITDQDEALYFGDHHIYMVVRQLFRQQNWFNLVDMWRCAASSRHMPGPGTRPYLDRSDALPFLLPEGRKVALNPGSTASDRRWPAEHFARLAERLKTSGLVPILVGAPTDEPVCAEVQRACEARLPDFCGQTSVAQMARLLAEVDLLVSNDTGAVHMAAAVGTRVLGLYGATAYFAETAPWGQGHLVLQGPLGPCAVQLEPELVLTAVRNRLGMAEEDTLRCELANARATAWETFFLPPHADPLGGLAYRPLHQTQIGVDDLFSRALRHAFANTFCRGKGELSLDYLRGWLQPLRCGGSSNGVSQVRPAIAPALVVLENMGVAAAKCRQLARTLSPQNGARIAALTDALIKALEALKRSTSEIALLTPVVQYLDWKFQMMPPMPPDATFQFHQKEYMNAGEMLRQAATLVEDFMRG